MNVLVLGSGGREHAISWKLAQSPKLSKLYVAPGNAGTTELAENLNIDVNDFNEIKKAVLANNINLVIVGPEDPLVNGVVDFFLKDEEIKNIPIIGPQAEAAQLEGSKEYSKRFMQRWSVCGEGCSVPVRAMVLGPGWPEGPGVEAQRLDEQRGGDFEEGGRPSQRRSHRTPR